MKQWIKYNIFMGILAKLQYNEVFNYVNIFQTFNRISAILQRKFSNLGRNKEEPTMR